MVGYLSNNDADANHCARSLEVRLMPAIIKIRLQCHLLDANVIQHDFYGWSVIDKDDDLIQTGFVCEAYAWDWIEDNL